MKQKSQVKLSVSPGIISIDKELTGSTGSGVPFVVHSHYPLIPGTYAAPVFR
ncbi:hypothetical protein M5G07_10595 [Serratia symbiotica]|nr:hypothetical protein [Serratia symbiotica]